MKCPVCESELVAVERQGVEIDYCPRCRGCWLDRGELDKIVERSANFVERRSDDEDSDDWTEDRRRAAPPGASPYPPQYPPPGQYQPPGQYAPPGQYPPPGGHPPGGYYPPPNYRPPKKKESFFERLFDFD